MWILPSQSYRLLNLTNQIIAGNTFLNGKLNVVPDADFDISHDYSSLLTVHYFRWWVKGYFCFEWSLLRPFVASLSACMLSCFPVDRVVVLMVELSSWWLATHLSVRHSFIWFINLWSIWRMSHSESMVHLRSAVGYLFIVVNFLIILKLSVNKWILLVIAIVIYYFYLCTENQYMDL